MTEALMSSSQLQPAEAAAGPSPAVAGGGPPAAADTNVAGGRPTISPPANVILNKINFHYIVLLSGFDGLKLAVDISWDSDRFFKALDDSQRLAAECRRPVPIQLEAAGDEKLLFLIKPVGTSGWSWVFHNQDFHIVLGGWLQPSSRPSAMVEIRSEALWRLGPKAAVELIASMFQEAGAREIVIKPSRVDLCVDLLVPEKLWKVELLDLAVCRANFTPHYKWPILTGFSFGKGNFAARIYDKPREIAEKSQKWFFFDLWGLEEVPEEKKVLRVECQVLREVLRELDVDTFDDLMRLQKHLWSYFSTKWLKFQTYPEKHYSQRITHPFWRAVQDGYDGSQWAAPLIRAKVVRQDMKRARGQLVGQLTSFNALVEDPEKQNEVCDLEKYPKSLREEFLNGGISDGMLARGTVEKMAKFHRAKEKYLNAETLRFDLGLKEVKS